MRVALAARIAATLGIAILTSCDDGGGSSDLPTAGIRVTVVTEGNAPDPDGYTLSIDGGPGQRISVNEIVSLDELTAGSHSVALGDLAANCHASGTQERTVTLEGGMLAEMGFTLVCNAGVGAVRVEVVTSGPDPDHDGYMVSISGRPTRVLSNAQAVVMIEEGEQAVAMTGVATNCAASPGNPSTVAVVANQLVTLRLDVTCTAITGTIRVAAVSTGGNIDPDGYLVYVEGAVAPVELGANGTVVFQQQLQGSRSVTLSGVQANCVVEGGAARAVNVVVAGTVEVRFEVRCTTAARVTVTVATTATPPLGSLPSSFTVMFESANAPTSTASVPSNGSITIDLAFAGEYSVSLRTNFFTCRSSPAVQVVASGSLDAAATFTVTCFPRRPPP